MRYYSLDIGGPAPRTFTSLINGKTDPGALLVEFDITAAPYHQPAPDSYVRIWGISLKDIAQATDFNGKPITVKAGMQKGLPLANPAQAGTLVVGSILQAFGNWQDTTQTLDFILGPKMGTPDAPQNIIIDWKSGAKMGDAIGATLSTAFPSYRQNIAISPNLVLSHDAPGYYASTRQFAEFINGISRSIVGGDYPGVSITVRGDNTIDVLDGTTTNTARDIAFTDLIGQPTWIGPQQIQFKCPVRADLQIGDDVTLPRTAVTTTAQSLSQFRGQSVFQGKFKINLIRHVGNSRQPDASAWVTTIDAALTPS